MREPINIFETADPDRAHLNKKIAEDERMHLVLMLDELKKHAQDASELDNYVYLLNSTLITDVKLDSFIFVIEKAIRYIEDHKESV